MERLHPNKRRNGLTLAFSVAMCLAGCNHQQMASSNPFMAPDRVPPPATRTIAPGTAAPYYPGDPMPAAQVAPIGQPLVAQVPAAAPVPTPTPPAAAPPIATTPQPLAFSNERTVSIPTDNEQLRFAVPPPPAVENPTPQPIQPPATPQIATNPTPAPAPASQVIPAAYNQPSAAQPADFAVPPATADADSGGPWRSPQIQPTGSPVMQAQYIQPQTPPGQPTILAAQPPQLQATPAAPTMPVELRTVPSPQITPLEPTVVPPPRIRFPSLTDPVSWFSTPTAPAANQQLIGYMVPGPNGAMQMVPLEQYQQMQTAAGPTQQPTSVASADGFRPRGSAK